MKCGNMWTATIRGVAEPTAAAAPTTAAPKRRGPGRPPGSRNRSGSETNAQANASVAQTPENKAARNQSMERNFDVGPINEMERLAQQRENAGALRGPGSMFSPPDAGPLFTPPPAPLPAAPPPALNRNMSVNEPPKWCECGLPLTWNRMHDNLWTCEKGHMPVKTLTVKQGMPGENFAQLVIDAEKHGVKLSIIDVCGWTSLQRDTLREWIKQGGDKGEFSRPAFVEQIEPDPEPEPDVEPETEMPRPRFTF
jgi:hypothetical protein